MRIKKLWDTKGKILKISGELAEEFEKLQQLIEDTNEEISERELDDDDELMRDLREIEIAQQQVGQAFIILDEIGGLDG